MKDKQRPIGKNKDNEKKNLLLVSKGFFHPSLLVRWNFRMLLQTLHKDYQITYTSKLDDLSLLKYDISENTADSNDRNIDMDTDINTNSDKPYYDGIILLFHEKVLSPHLLEIIRKYLARGGGLMAVHGAMASFKAMPEYAHILGSKFTGHGTPGKIKVSKALKTTEVPGPTESSKPSRATKISKPSKTSIPNKSYSSNDSFTIKDELYLYDFDNTNRVLWWGESGGETAAIVWTRTEGAGRVFCFSLGHYASTFKSVHVKGIITEGLSWITGGEEPW